MRLLLDTHIWLWSLLEPKRLSKAVLKELGEKENELWLSPISIWETLLLSQKRKIDLGQAPRKWIADGLAKAAMKEAPVNTLVALETGRLQMQHRDPADRFLVATAIVFDLRLVTADERLLQIKDVAVLAND